MRKAELFQKVLALVLCAVMLVGYLPGTVFTALADEATAEGTGGETAAEEAEEVPEATADGGEEVDDGSVPDGLQFAVEDETVTIVGYGGSASELVIPAEIEGLPVTRIEAYAFAGNQVLTSVVLPDSVTRIGEWAFGDCSDLTSVVLPDGLCVLDYDVFSNDEKLAYTEYENGRYLGSRTNPYACLIGMIDREQSQITIHADTKNIGGNAIWGFDNLTELAIHNGVLSIGVFGVYNCANLTALTIGSGVEQICSGNFYDLNNLEAFHVSEDNKFFSTDESGVLFNKDKSRLIKAPAKVADDYQIPESVSVIGENAFSYCHNLTTITIPDTVGTIEDSAFSCCTNLRTVFLPNSLAEPGNYVFSGCGNLEYNIFGNGQYIGSTENPYLMLAGIADREATSLQIHSDTKFIASESCINSMATELTIPDSVVYIGSYAFVDSAITTLTIGSGLERMDRNPFMYCPNLLMITVSEENGFFCADSSGVLYDKEMKILLKAPQILSGSYEVPETVERIGEGAFFACVDLTSVIIPDSVRILENMAFYNCSNLTLYFSMCSGFAGLAKEWNIAFVYNDTLKALSIETQPDKLQYAVGSKLRTSGLSLRAVLTDDTAMILTDGFTVDPCDTSTEGTKTVVVHCGNLSVSFDITVDAGIIDLPESEHPYANNMDETWTYTHPTEVIGLWITFSADTQTEPSCDTITVFDASGAQVGIYSGTELMGKTVGVAGSSFTIRLQTDVSVTQYGFTVESVSEITSEEDLPETVPAGLEYGITEDGNAVIFYYTGSEASLVIPGKINGCPVTRIENGAFFGNATLTSVTVPDSVTTIGIQAFAECNNLNSVTLGSGVTELGEGAFNFCVNLTSINIPESLEVIGYNAFNECNSLTVSVYDNARYIGPENNPCKFLLQCTNNDISSCAIHPDTKVICGSAFANCNSLTTIAIPEGVTRICERAFNGCSNLTALELPDSLQTIENCAFINCSNLESVTLGSGLANLGEQVFSSCFCLQSVQVDENNPYFCTDASGVLFNKDRTELLMMPCGYEGSYEIPDTVQIIGSYAFCNCEWLSKITIPEGVNTIGSCAFQNCNNLLTITIPASVTEIGADAFAYCGSLRSLVVDENNTAYSSDEMGTLYDKEKTILITVRSSISGVFQVPETVQVIGELAFNGCSGITEIVLPEGVTTIRSAAFIWCSSLKKVTVPDTVTSIAEGVFEGSSVTMCCSVNSYAAIYAEENSIPVVYTDIAKELTIDALPDKLVYPLWGKLNLNGLSLNVTFDDDTVKTVTAGYTVDDCDTSEAGTKTVTIHCCGLSATFEITVDASLIEYPESDHPYGRNADETWKYVHPTEALGLRITFSGDTYVENYGDYILVYDANGVLMGEYTGDSLAGETVAVNGSTFTVRLVSDQYGSECYGFAVAAVEEITSEEELPEAIPYGLQYNIQYECVTITGYSSIESVLRIPASIDGYPVTEILPGALNDWRLTEVYIPETVTFLHGNSFASGNLLAIWVDENNPVYSSDENGVLFDKARTELIAVPKGYAGSYTVPDSVATIGEGAFANMPELTSVVIPAGVTNIIDNVFWDCSSLTGIWVDAENASYCSDENGVLFDKPMGRLMKAPVTLSGSYVIPSTVITVDHSAFYRCLDLTAVTVPDSVTYMAEYAFGECYNLTLYVSAGSYAESYAAAQNIPYQYTTPVEAISIAVLPDRLVYPIGGTVYLNGLTLNVVLSDSTTRTATAGFTMDPCDTSTAGVKTVTVHYAGLTVTFEITVDADMVLYPESDHPYENDMDESWTYTHETEAEALAITFSSDTETETGCDFIYLYDADENQIGQYDGSALSGQTVLVPGNSFTIRLTTDGSVTCYGFTVTNVEATTVPTASDALDALYALYPNGMEDGMVLTDTVTVNGMRFTVQWMITSGENAVSVEDNCIVFYPQPEDVEYQIVASIVDSGLTAVWDGTVARTETAETEPDVDETLWHYYTCEEGYAVVTGYDGTDTEVTVPAEIAGYPVTVVDNECFSNNSNLRYVTIPEGVTEIGDYAFRSCTNLISVSIPQSVSVMGMGVFRNCDSLTDVSIPEGITSIGHYMFTDCSHLENITIPANVTEIGDNAFYNCGSLTALVIPEEVRDIGCCAFGNCTGLCDIFFEGNAPAIDAEAFLNVTATAHYPVNNDTWTDDVMQSYGGSITWIAGCEHSWGEWVIVQAPTFTSAGFRETTCTICGDVIAEEIPAVIGKVERWNVSLLDDLQVNFHLQISESIADTARVKVMTGDKVQTYRAADLELTEDGLYRVSVNIAAAQMNDDIVLVIMNAHSMGDAVSYSVQQYAETVLADENLSQYHAMVREMLNYGAAAQSYFNYNADNLVNDGITDVAAAEIPGKADQELRIEGGVAGITQYANSLVFADRIAVRFYYIVTGDIADYSFTVGDTVYEPVQKGDYYYVEVSGITPENLDQQIEMTVTGQDGSTLTVAYSPMNYIVRMNVKGSESLKTLLKALYNYHLAAKALKEIA